MPESALMDDPSIEEFLTIRFTDRATSTETASVSATALVQALAGFQRAVHLLAMHSEQKEIKSRARVSRDIEKRFPIVCHAPRIGCYDLPITIGSAQRDLLSPQEIDVVSQGFQQLLYVVSQGDDTAFRRIIPDTAYRRPIAKALRDALPPSSVAMKVISPGGDTIFSSENASQRLSELTSPVDDKISAASIFTGKLVAIDFAANRIVLQDPRSGKKIDCFYDPSIESTLLENARDFVQVIGDIELNNEGTAERITDVIEILSVDLDPIIKDAIFVDNVIIIATKPLVISPKLTDDKQGYIAEIEDLGISLCAMTRDDLELAIEDEFEILWVEYATEDDNALSPKARELKLLLNQMFMESK